MAWTDRDLVRQGDSRRQLGREWLVVGLLVLVAVVVRALPVSQSSDDAYITYRYAHNLVRAPGFVYNPGEHVLGTTSPLFTLVLAALDLAGVTPERAAPVLATLAGSLVTGLVYALARVLGAARIESMLAALLWATEPLSIRVECSGMECSLFLAAALLGFVLQARDEEGTGTRESVPRNEDGGDGEGAGTSARAGARAGAGAGAGSRVRALGVGLLGGLATLLRPEGVLVLAALALGAAARRRLPRLEAVGAGVVLLPWVMFAWIRFGSPVPHSVVAKAVTLEPGTSARVASLFATDASFLLRHGFGTPLEDAFLGVVCVVALAFAAIRRFGRGGSPAALFALAYLAAYLIACPNLFLWYHVPPMPVALAAVAASFTAVVGLLSRTGARLAARACFAGGVALACARSAALVEPAPGGGLQIEIEVGALDEPYRVAAQRLRALGAGPTTRVASLEIGNLGYLLPEVPILDLAGLVSPEALPFAREVGARSVSPRALTSLTPEWVVLPSTFAGRVFDDPAVGERYAVVETIEGSERLGPVYLLRLRESERR